MNRTQRLTLIVVSLATAMLMLDIAVVNTALPQIARDLDTGLSGLQWVVDAYTLALASVVLSAGFLADRLGRRRLFYVGLSLFTVTSLVAGMAPDIHILNIARAVQGIGGAIMFAVSLSLLAQAFPAAKERAGALAVYGATIGASFAVGPLVGGALTSGLDWRWVFFINLPIGIAAIVLTRAGVEESKDPNPRRIDWPGQATLAGGLFLLVLALLRGNEQGWTSTPIIETMKPGSMTLQCESGVMLSAIIAWPAAARNRPTEMSSFAETLSSMFAVAPATRRLNIVPGMNTRPASTADMFRICCRYSVM